MATTQQILDIEFEKLKVDLIAEYDAMGMRASGEFERELEVRSEPLQATLLGAEHSEQLEYGRGKTGSSATTSAEPLIEKIKRWIIQKGITAQGITPSSLAFLITRKIHREGWDRAKHGGVGLISRVITEQRMQSIIDKIGNEMTMILVGRLEKELIKINK